MGPVPKIDWGGADHDFPITLHIAYPLDNMTTYPEPAEGSEWIDVPAGNQDSWLTGQDDRLAGDARWIPDQDTTDPVATGWQGATGWRAFLEYARAGKPFRVYQDKDSADYVLSVLVSPRRDEPALERDGTRRLRLEVRSVDGESFTADQEAAIAVVPGLYDQLNFDRASDATRVQRTLALDSVAADVPRTTWVAHPVTGLLVPTLPVELASTNEISDPNDFAASGTSWGGATSFTITTATSFIDGQTAYQHENSGAGPAQNRAQTFGVLTNAPETFYIIVENVDASETAIGIRDMAVNDWVALVQLDWSAGTAAVTASGVGTDAGANLKKLADSGPNGGAVYLLAVTGTPSNAGNSRAVFIRPTGVSTNTDTVILHHAQHEELAFHTSPIVGTGTGPFSRAVESAELVLPPGLTVPNAVDFTEYFAFVAGFDGDGGLPFPGIAILGGDNTTEGLQLHNDGNGRLDARLQGGSTDQLSDVPIVPQRGQLVEAAITWNRAKGITRFTARLNGGTPAGGTPSPVTPASSWAVNTLRVGDRGTGTTSAHKHRKVALALREITGSDAEILDAGKASFQ